MVLQIANISDVGRRRPHNEDSTATDAEHGLLILADGMGGYKAGEVASAIAVLTVLEDIKAAIKDGETTRQLPDGTNGAIPDLVRQAINHANTMIYDLAQKEAECQGMGTTIVTGVIHGNIITVGNVGDSRLYRFRAGKLQQITKDHSLIQELIDRGLYTPEEAMAKMPKNLVTRALGLSMRVEVDIIQEPVETGDIYLLCSDGLNDMVNDEEIHLTLSKYSANLVQAAENLVQLANSKGGRDNISVVLVRITNDTKSRKKGVSLRKYIERFFDVRG
jgi:protein phosphatase